MILLHLLATNSQRGAVYAGYITCTNCIPLWLYLLAHVSNKSLTVASGVLSLRHGVARHINIQQTVHCLFVCLFFCYDSNRIRNIRVCWPQLFKKSLILSDWLDYDQSQWPCCLWSGPAASRLLGLRVRIPPRTWLSVSFDCCVLSGRGSCEGPIPRPEESYRVCVRVCAWVWSGAIRTFYNHSILFTNGCTIDLP
jgi:hypothetical protein